MLPPDDEERSLADAPLSSPRPLQERLDYSCALFSPTAQLVANAPFVPVHLGSMCAW